MGRTSNTARRREEIVSGLLRVMARRGYERASVLEIAREAGLTPGLLHYHFSTKQEILLDLVARIGRLLEERLRLRLARAGSAPRPRLFAWIDAHVGLGPDADPAAMACWVAIGAEALRQPEVRKVYERAVAADVTFLRGLLRDVLRDERRSEERAVAMAAGLRAAVEGAYQLGCAAPGTIPRGSAAPMIRRMAEGLIAAEPRKRRSP
jgi:TetR/AcrR family transcriptional regulator, transcriptional repressor of bet genes